MLDTVRRKAADGLRILTALSIGEAYAPVRAAKKIAGRVADLLAPLDGSGGNGSADLAATPVAPVRTAYPASHDGIPRTPLSIEAGQLRGELDAGAEMVLIDVREPHETAHGIIPGARLIPMNRILEHAAEIRESRKPVVVYCALGARSHQAVLQLRERGCTQVMDLIGGIEAWRANGGEIRPPASSAVA